MGSPTLNEGMRCGAPTALFAAVPTWPGSGAWARWPISQFCALTRESGRGSNCDEGAHWPTWDATRGTTEAGPRQNSAHWQHAVRREQCATGDACARADELALPPPPPIRLQGSKHTARGRTSARLPCSRSRGVPLDTMADNPPTEEAPVQAADGEPAAEGGEAETGKQETGEEGGEAAAQNGTAGAEAVAAA